MHANRTELQTHVLCLGATPGHTLAGELRFVPGAMAKQLRSRTIPAPGNAADSGTPDNAPGTNTPLDPATVSRRCPLYVAPASRGCVRGFNGGCVLGGRAGGRLRRRCHDARDGLWRQTRLTTARFAATPHNRRRGAPLPVAPAAACMLYSNDIHRACSIWRLMQPPPPPPPPPQGAPSAPRKSLKSDVRPLVRHGPTMHPATHPLLIHPPTRPHPPGRAACMPRNFSRRLCQSQTIAVSLRVMASWTFATSSRQRIMGGK